MLKTRLGNEFGDPRSHNYQRRQTAFEAYNELTEQAPEDVARVMATLAIGGDVNYDDKLAKKIFLTSENILNATNNGTQIGVMSTTREAAWAEVFDDEGHREAVREYAQFKNGERQSPEAIEACRRRGMQTLKVIALTHLTDERRNQFDMYPTSDTELIFAA
jgi:hypothetical protein